MKALRLFLFVALATATLFSLSLMRAAAAPSSTIVVNSALDGATTNDGNCTLREAILNANGNDQSGSTDCAAGAGADNITFSIGSGGLQTINVTGSSLPDLSGAVTLDGASQPLCSSYPCIELNGSGAGVNGVGIRITGGNSTVRGLVINQFRLDGMRLDSNGGNVISGNFIGTDVTGTVSRANNLNGIAIEFGSSNNLIGGTTPAARNLISGNGGAGVWITDANSKNNVVLGNYIGSDAAGTAAVGNGGDGVLIASTATNNTIGGTTAVARNIISGNGGNGVSITDNGTDGNVITGNFIGTDVTGGVTLGNQGSGVSVTGGFNQEIGGTLDGARNIISGNIGDNVVVSGSQTSANIINNYIGTDVTGSYAINDGASDGVHISASFGGEIAKNLISGHEDGIVVSSPSSFSLIQGNWIGTTADGIHKIGNQGVGIKVNGSSGNFIGGESEGDGNVIAFSGDNGVQVNGNKNGIRRNSIFSNEGLGIDLGGGGNNSQAAPALTSAINGSGTTISGSLTSANNTTYHIEFFSNAACDDSGSGEGQTYIGTMDVTTNGSGTANINFVAASNVPAGQVITATATDPTDNTSQFSNCVNVQPPPPPCTSSPAAATLLTPIDGSLAHSRAVTLDWSDVGCATYYRLRVKQDSTTSKIIAVKQNNIPVSEFLTPLLTKKHFFFWRVRACNAIGCGPWTPYFGFKVAQNATLH